MTVATFALLMTGLAGAGATVAQVVAAGALAVYAAAASRVCAPVARAVRQAKPTAARPLVLGVCGWFVVAVWADVMVVALGRWAWLDVVGLIALAGVLAQAIIATLIYLAPMLRGRTTGSREAMRLRLEVGATARAVVLNAGVTLLALGVSRLGLPGPLVGIGWLLVGGVVLAAVAVVIWPLRVSAAPPHAGEYT